MPSQKNTNGNANGDTVTVPLTSGGSVEALPIAAAASHLGVTLPRLQRVLRRSEFTAEVFKAERPTRTGTRTVTLVSISVLEALKEALIDGESEQKRKHYHPEAFVFSPGEADQRHRAALELLTREYSARIEEQARTIEDLRRDKDELRGEKEKLIEEHKREHSRALALAFELESMKALPAVEQKEASGLAGASQSESEGQSGVIQAPMVPEGEKRGLWSFLRRWW